MSARWNLFIVLLPAASKNKRKIGMKNEAAGRAYGEPYGYVVNSNHFTVNNEPLGRQLLAWRECVSHMIDVIPSIEKSEQPFRASIDRYTIGDRLFTDCLPTVRPMRCCWIDRSRAYLQTTCAVICCMFLWKEVWNSCPCMACKRV